MGKFAFIRIGNPYWDSLIRINNPYRGTERPTGSYRRQFRMKKR